MALKYELEQWGAAVKAYDDQNFDEALDTFETIADSAKFHFNMGLIYATLGEHEEACRSYKKSVKLDQYFAVAYFQKGVSHFLLSEFDKALANFNDALLYLRGNMLIDYEQLGLKFRLYSCEVLFNRGLCYLYIGQTDKGMGDFNLALKEKQTEEHDVIDEAISVQGQGFTVFSIPVGVIYRPPEGKLKNVKTKDYLGKAKLVAAVDPEDAFTGFTGAQQQKKAQFSTTTPITKAKTDGAVATLDNVDAGLDSPTETTRPKSLSTNPRSPPFPMRTTRNSSLRRRPEEGIKVFPYMNEVKLPTSEGILRTKQPAPILDNMNNNLSGQDGSDLQSQVPRNNSIRRPYPNQLRMQQNLQRSKTVDSGRPSSNVPNVPVRINSVRNQTRPGPQRSNSLRDLPVRSNSLKGASRGRRPVPRRQDTATRTQFLQQQMQKMNVADSGYTDYFEDAEQYNANSIDDYNQLYDYATGDNSQYNSDNDNTKVNLTGLNYNKNRNPGEQRSVSPARSPSLRGRGASSPSRGVSFKSSPLALQGESMSPPPDDSERNYASLIFNGDDDGYSYGDDDDVQFEMLPPPQKSLKDISKIKIKCYYKDDTRIILVAANIAYEELMKRIQEKFASDNPLKLQYKDEDGTKVMMGDQEDLEMAISMVPKSTSDTGRMEIWID